MNRLNVILPRHAYKSLPFFELNPANTLLKIIVEAYDCLLRKENE